MSCRQRVEACAPVEVIRPDANARAAAPAEFGERSDQRCGSSGLGVAAGCAAAPVRAVDAPGADGAERVVEPVWMCALAAGLGGALSWAQVIEPIVLAPYCVNPAGPGSERCTLIGR